METINYGDPEPHRDTAWRVNEDQETFIYRWHQELGGWSWSGKHGIAWRHLHHSNFPMTKVEH